MVTCQVESCIKGVDVGGKKKMRYRQRGVLEIDIPKSELKDGYSMRLQLI